ncbi:Thiolase, N-terminal domain [Streptomyces atratus]|uniref:Thiolase, N-terminal domain n=1 Tax=Streptomyces atratus TaxID=1893 RepID=A0A1K2ER97_STRAR|nr:Thiolase, N-terminal domain [Streptomyces atratus]
MDAAVAAQLEAGGVRRVGDGGGQQDGGPEVGPYARASNQQLLTAALDGPVERFGLRGERVGEFAAGAVLKHSRDFGLARETVLGSALDPRTPAYDVQQACGTGLQAVVAAPQP